MQIMRQINVRDALQSSLNDKWFFGLHEMKNNNFCMTEDWKSWMCPDRCPRDDTAELSLLERTRPESTGWTEQRVDSDHTGKCPHRTTWQERDEWNNTSKRCLDRLVKKTNILTWTGCICTSGPDGKSFLWFGSGWFVDPGRPQRAA